MNKIKNSILPHFAKWPLARIKSLPYGVLFLSTILLIIGFTVLSVSLLYRSQKDRYWAEHRRKMEIELTGLSAAIFEMEAETKSALINHSTAKTPEIGIAENNVKIQLRKASGLTLDVWSQVEELNSLNTLVLEQKSLLQNLIETNKNPEKYRHEEQQRLSEKIKNVDARIQLSINKMISYEQRLYSTRTKNIYRNEQLSVILVTAFGLITAAISILGYVRIVTDNQKRDRAELARIKAASNLQQSELRYRNLTESANDAVIIINHSGSIISWNRMAEVIFGYSKSETDTLSLTKLFPTENKLIASDHSIITPNEHVTRFETTALTKAGLEIPIELSQSGWTVNNENFIGYTARDLREQKITLVKLDQAIKELQRSNLDLEQFAYVASHDLQEPLRKIQSFSDRFMSTIQDMDQLPGLDYFVRMRKSAFRMQVLIQDLLQYSRLTRNEESLGPVDLNMLLNRAKDDLQLVIDEKKALIQADSLPTLKKANETQCFQLFLNLLSNALKFAKPNVAPVISIACKQIPGKENPFPELHLLPDTTYHQITITDNGIGFDPVYLDKIFTIFQRLNGRSEYEGTGIGLAICQKICLNHQGFITAQSTPNEGSTFIVLLPENPSELITTESLTAILDDQHT